MPRSRSSYATSSERSTDVAQVLRDLLKAIGASRPGVEIVIRGDSHYARPEAEAALYDALEESLPAT